MPLPIALTSAALLLAVPVGFVAFLLAFRAVGPWRTRPRIVPLPDLADERQAWVRRTPPAALPPAMIVVQPDDGLRGARTRSAAHRHGRPQPFDRIPLPADARPAA